MSNRNSVVDIAMMDIGLGDARRKSSAVNELQVEVGGSQRNSLMVVNHSGTPKGSISAANGGLKMAQIINNPNSATNMASASGAGGSGSASASARGSLLLADTHNNNTNLHHSSSGGNIHSLNVVSTPLSSRRASRAALEEEKFAYSIGEPSRALRRSNSGKHLDVSTQVEPREIIGILPSEEMLGKSNLDSNVFIISGEANPTLASYNTGDTEAVLLQQMELERLKSHPTLKQVKRTRTMELDALPSNKTIKSTPALDIGKTRTQALEQERQQIGYNPFKWLVYWRKKLLRKKVLQKDPIPLFRHSIKVIEGHLGTAVASFFVFTRWVFLLNLAIAIMWLCLTTFPQLANPPTRTHESFSPLNILTGGGYLANTTLFYAGYDSVAGEYKMDLAYVIAIGLTYIVSFISILYSLSARLTKNRDPTALVARDTTYPFAVATLGSWDYSIRDDEGAVIMHLGIAHTLKEITTITKTKLQVKTKKELAKLYFQRFLTITITLGMLALCAYIVYVLIKLQADNRDSDDNAILLVTPIAISTMNLIVPWLFTKILILEKWDSQDAEVKITTVRSFFIRLASVIAVIVSIWQTRDSNECWQNRVGQELYRMVLVDMVLTSVFTVIQQFGWRWMKDKILNKGNKVDFDMPKNVLDITYRQTLIWFGCIFCPVIPAIGTISIMITFYIRKFTYLKVSKQPRRFFSATRSNAFFLFTLLVSLVLIFIPVGYILVDGTPICGPHKGLTTIYSVVPSWVNTGPHWIIVLTQYLFSVAFLMPFCLFLIATILYVVSSKKKNTSKIKELQSQLEMERADKRFLLKQYNLVK